jgi:ABC-type sugar transport system substrate-binding protein
LLTERLSGDRRSPAGIGNNDHVLRTVRLMLAVVLAAAGVVACSSHKQVAPGLAHARTACSYWAAINAGVSEPAQRQQKSADFQREATAAAAADPKYKPLQTAAESWSLTQQTPTSPASIDALRSAIDQSRSACAGVPKK